MIVLENVRKQYDGGRYAVRDVSLRVEAGQLLVLLGGSGCGETMAFANGVNRGML